MSSKTEAEAPAVFRLRHSNGTYYVGLFGIGPKFGGTVLEAKTFPSLKEAALEIGKHWAMGECEVEEAFDG